MHRGGIRLKPSAAFQHLFKRVGKGFEDGTEVRFGGRVANATCLFDKYDFICYNFFMKNTNKIGLPIVV